MDLRRGHYRCNVCYRVAPLGWVYICTEDTDVAEEWWCNRENPSKDVPDNIAELESLGFSKSVIDAAAIGFYTPEQIDKLKSQKRHLHEINAGCALQKENINPESRADLLIAPAVQPPATSDSFPMIFFGDFRLWNDSKPMPRLPNDKCRFQCCHSCRPHSADRAFISFEAVFGGEFRPINRWDPASMPVDDANIMRNLGLRPVEHPVPVDDLKDEIVERKDDSDEELLYWDDGGWLRRSQEEHERIKRISGNRDQSNGVVVTNGLETEFLRVGEGNVREGNDHRSGPKHLDDIPVYTEDQQQRKGETQAMDTVFRLRFDSSNELSPRISASSLTIPGKYNGYDEDAEDVSLGLFNMMTSGTQNIRGNTQPYGAPRTAYQGFAERDSDDFEGEVEGGVALTEEAAETCTADLITAL